MPRVFLVAGLIALSGALLFFFRQPLIRGSLNLYLSSQGVEITSLQGLNLRADGVDVDRLRLTFSGQQLDASFVQLGWRFSGGLRDLFVDVLVVEPSGAGSLQGAGTPLSAMLASSENLPLRKIQVSRLRLPSQAPGWEFFLNSDSRSATLKGMKADYSLNAELGWPAAGSADLNLGLVLLAAGVEFVNLKGRVSPAGEDFRVALQAQLELEKARQVLMALLPDTVFSPPVEGSLAVGVDFIQQDTLDRFPEKIRISLSSPTPLRLGLEALSKPLQVGLVDSLLLEVSRAGDGFHVSSDELRFLIEGGQPLGDLSLDLELSALSCRLNARPDCEMRHREFVRGMGLQHLASGVKLDQLSWQGEGGLKGAGDFWQLTLAPGLEVRLENMQWPGVLAQALRVFSEQEQSLDLNISPLSLDAGLRELSLELIGFSHEHFTLSGEIQLAQGTVHYDQALTAGVDLQSRGLALSAGDVWLPDLDSELKLDWRDGELAFEGRLFDQQKSWLDLNGRHEVVNQRGGGELRLETITFSAPEETLSDLLPGWPFPLDLLEGSLGGRAGLAWNLSAGQGLELNAGFEIEMQGLGGTIQDVFFQGANTVLQGDYSWPAGKLEIPGANLAVAKLDLGLPLEDMTLSFALDADAVEVQQWRAGLLGGGVVMAQQRYDFHERDNRLALGFNNIQLAEVMALVDYDGIEVSGEVSGILPLAFKGRQLSIAGGTLQAEAPGGVIRYQSGTAADANAAFELVNEALSNYHYESMLSTVSYGEEGELLLAMRLQGHNPDMNGGQRINLNLNLSDNIPQLLESLQAGRAINDFFERQYQ